MSSFIILLYSSVIKIIFTMALKLNYRKSLETITVFLRKKRTILKNIDTIIYKLCL